MTIYPGEGPKKEIFDSFLDMNMYGNSHAVHLKLFLLDIEVVELAEVVIGLPGLLEFTKVSLHRCPKLFDSFLVPFLRAAKSVRHLDITLTGVWITILIILI